MKQSLKKKDEEEFDDSFDPEEIENEVLGDSSEANLPAIAGSVGMVTGDIGIESIRVPILKLAQKTGDYADGIKPGDITIDGESLVTDDDGVCRLTVVSCTGLFQVKTPFGSGPGDIYHTAHEVLDAGLSIETATNPDGQVERIAHAVVLIEKPEGLESRAFPFEFEGKQYSPARWYLSRSAYGTAAKNIFTKVQFDLREAGILSGRWELTAEKRKGKKGEYFVPRLLLQSEANSKEFMNWIQKTFAG